MPRTYPVSIVDVFAERPLAGNQLAVVHDADSLSDAQMQAIARETNFSETTFVTGFAGETADVRIFTPAWELPFAGHPTVGTAWELTQGVGDITLNLGLGPVPVSFVDGIGWMRPPEVALEDEWDVARAAELIRVGQDDIATDLPVQFAQVGPQFVIIPVRSLSVLKNARLDGDLHAQLLADGLGVQCVFVFCSEPYGPDADFASRMFFESAGVREDPATGSANTAFAAYLRAHRGPLGDVVVDQGVEIQRPSRLYLKVAETLQVGGRVQSVFRGELTL